MSDLLPYNVDKLPQPKPSDLKRSVPSGFGCLGTGIMIVFGILFLLSFVLVLFSIWMSSALLSSEPPVVPQVFLTQKEFNELQKRKELINDYAAKDENEPLEICLSADEINAMLQEPMVSDYLIGYVAIADGNDVAFVFSLPVEGGGKTFLTMRGICGLAMKEGQIDVQIREMRIGNFDLPEGGYLNSFFMQMLDSKNIKKAPLKLWGIKIEDEKFYITLKKRADSDLRERADAK